jgi:hypothetical protein
MSSRTSSLGRKKRGSQSPTKRGSDSPSKGSATPNTTSTRSMGPYDRAFQQHLIDHKILPDSYEYPDGRIPPEPDNMDEIASALGRPRASLSPQANSQMKTPENSSAQIRMHPKRERSQHLSYLSSRETLAIANVLPVRSHSRILSI